MFKKYDEDGLNLPYLGFGTNSPPDCGCCNKSSKPWSRSVPWSRQKFTLYKININIKQK